MWFSQGLTKYMGAWLNRQSWENRASMAERTTMAQATTIVGGSHETLPDFQLVAGLMVELQLSEQDEVRMRHAIHWLQQISLIIQVLGLWPNPLELRHLLPALLKMCSFLEEAITMSSFKMRHLSRFYLLWNLLIYEEHGLNFKNGSMVSIPWNIPNMNF